MKSLFLIPLISVCILISGCKKNTVDNNDNNKTLVYLLTSITFTDPNNTTNTTTYKYDNQHRLTETVSGTMTRKFYYDSSDRLIQAETYYNAIIYTTFKYTYSVGTIAEEDMSYIHGVYNGSTFVTITLDSSQRMTKRDLGYSGPDHGYSIFTYDNFGNMTSITDYVNTLYDAHTYTFDNKKSPFSNVKGNFYLFTNEKGIVNNVVTDNYTGYYPIATSYTYTYNSNGYPESGIQTSTTQFPNITPTTYTVHYNYSLQ